MLKLYLVCLICFLFLISLLITTEIYQILINYRFVNNNIVQTNQNTLSLAKVYIKQKKWLSSILILESYILKQDLYLTNYYNSIGFCYYYIQIHTLSEYYYFQAIDQDSSNLIALFNLAKLYTLIKKYKDAIIIYEKILRVDETNVSAHKQIKALILKSG